MYINWNWIIILFFFLLITRCISILDISLIWNHKIVMTDSNTGGVGGSSTVAAVALHDEAEIKFKKGC